MRTSHNDLDRLLLLAITLKWISLTESVIIQRSRQKHNVNARSRSEAVFLSADNIFRLLMLLLFMLLCTVFVISSIIWFNRRMDGRAEAKKSRADQNAT